MSSKSKDMAAEQAEMAPVQRIRSDWKMLLEKVSYKAIVNNIPYLAFIALLGVLYINNSQRAIETQRELNKQNKVLKELRWKYMDIKTQLMNARMETEVIKNAGKIGLKPMMLPAYKIEADSTVAKR
jgi:cell division protein FtsL